MELIKEFTKIDLNVGAASLSLAGGLIIGFVVGKVLFNIYQHLHYNKSRLRVLHYNSEEGLFYVTIKKGRNNSVKVLSIADDINVISYKGTEIPVDVLQCLGHDKEKITGR